MELIFEVIGELLLGFMEWIEEKHNISKWIRYPVLVLFMLFAVSVLLGLLLLGILVFQKNIVAGILIIATQLLLTFLFIYKIRKSFFMSKETK